MSPRSEEFMVEARERLAAARTLIDAGYAAPAISAAYYAMLYAARAALSERDLYAKTHRGVWSLFNEHFVQPGTIPGELKDAAQSAQDLREAGDYEAAVHDLESAQRVLENAEAFVGAVAELFGD